MVDVFDERAYIAFDVAIKLSHKQASMTDAILDRAEHAFGTICWCTRVHIPIRSYDPRRCAIARRKD